MDDAVAERFLGDSKETQRHVGVELSEIALRPEAHVNVMPLLDLDTVRLQCRREAEHPQGGRMQIV